ncbi:MAG: hypothetical protein HY749_24185 [Gammaproteobacteria bacterium]|nr:hypothetical protein [Gammaproteobacteria bacterium]
MHAPPCGGGTRADVSQLGHYDDELYALDQRIGRLAIACGIDISDDRVIVALIQSHYVLFHHQEQPERTSWHAQLRELLMLKYRVKSNCLEYLGAEACRTLLAAEHERLRRHGLTPPGEPKEAPPDPATGRGSNDHG